MEMWSAVFCFEMLKSVTYILEQMEGCLVKS